MKQIYFLLIAMLFFSNGNAQKVKPDITKFQGLLGLDKLPENLPKISDIIVVPILWDSTKLGYSESTISGNKLAVIPDKNMTAFLQEHVNNQYKKIFDPNGVQLLWIVQELRVNERSSTFWHKGYCRLKANVYTATNNKDFVLLFNFDTVLVRSAKSDPYIRHDKSIAQAMHLILQKLEGYDIATTIVNKQTADIQTILKKEQLRFNLPILKDTLLKDGVYMSFNEFKNNNPSFTNYEIANEKNKAIVQVFSIDSAKNSSIITNAWGFCKNGEIYKLQEQELIAIEKFSNCYLLSNYIESIRRKNNGIFMSALMGGIVGVVANSAFSKNDKIYTVTTIPYISEKQPEASAIDMETGELTF